MTTSEGRRTAHRVTGPSTPPGPSASASAPAAASASAAAETEPSAAELDAYLAAMADFKRRRMKGLAALCGLLLVPLVVIYAKHWWNVDPAHPVGRGWVFVGIAVTVCALGAVLADVLYRKEL